MKLKKINYAFVLFTFCLIYSCQDEVINDTNEDTQKAVKDATAFLRSDCNFEYEGPEGPENWATICNGANPDCGGSVQSPININKYQTVKDYELEDIEIDFEPSSTNIYNNGHTVQFNYDEGSTSTINGITYNLLQFHFHTKSEHTINGNHRKMEVHFVHQDPATGALAVIGAFFKRGRRNNVLMPFMNDLPEMEGDQYVSDETYDASDFFEDDYDWWWKSNNGKYETTEEEEDDKKFYDEFEFEKGESRWGYNVLDKYYTYSGSLTTPPCSEIVTWYVLKKPLRASRSQIKKFKEIMHENYRPTQELNGRIVRRN